MEAIWAPIMHLEIITSPGLFQFYLGVPHIYLSNFTNMGPVWALYRQKSLYGVHLGP